MKENEVWISTDRGLFRYNKNGNVVKQYQHDSTNPYSLSQNYLTDLAITNDKQLLVATLRGINIYNPITDDFERIAYDLPGNDSNSLNSILSIAYWRRKTIYGSARKPEESTY